MTKKKAKTVKKVTPPKKASSVKPKPVKPTARNLQTLVAQCLGRGMVATFNRIKGNGNSYNVNISKTIGKKTLSVSNVILENATKSECDETFKSALKALEK